MNQTLTPAEGPGSLQIGTPHILSLAPLSGALTLHHEAGMARIRAKSLALTDFLRRLADTELAPLGVDFATPRPADQRGGHIALVHPEAVRLCKALREVGVIPDFRPPNIVRLAPVALYTSFADCVGAVARLKTILSTRAYETQEGQRGLVP